MLRPAKGPDEAEEFAGAGAGFEDAVGEQGDSGVGWQKAGFLGDASRLFDLGLLTRFICERVEGQHAKALKVFGVTGNDSELVDSGGCGDHCIRYEVGRAVGHQL